MESQKLVPRFRFAPASEEDFIFGAERPGYGSKSVTKFQVDEWLSFMEDRGIRRVVCLLDNEQLEFYKNAPLLSMYKQRFGTGNVLHAMIPDFELCEIVLLLNQILPFLEESKLQSQKTVVHCAGGKGRTGHVLAAWIVRSQNKSPGEAISVVSSYFREPLEAVERGNASRENLDSLLLSSVK